MIKERPWRFLQIPDVQPSTLYLAENGNFLKPTRIFEVIVEVSSDIKEQLVSSLEKGVKPEIEFYNCSGGLVRTGVVYIEEDPDNTAGLKLYVPLTFDQEISLQPPSFEVFEGN